MSSVPHHSCHVTDSCLILYFTVKTVPLAVILLWSLAFFSWPIEWFVRSLDRLCRERRCFVWGRRTTSFTQVHFSFTLFFFCFFLRPPHTMSNLLFMIIFIDIFIVYFPHVVISLGSSTREQNLLPLTQPCVIHITVEPFESCKITKSCNYISGCYNGDRW